MTGVPHVTAKGRKKRISFTGTCPAATRGKGSFGESRCKIFSFVSSRTATDRNSRYLLPGRAVETAEGCFIYLDSCVSSSLGVKNIDFKIQEVLWLHAVCGPIRGEGEDGCW